MKKKKNRYIVEDIILNRCIAIGLSQKRFLRSSLKQTIYEKGLYADLHQEIIAAAIEAYNMKYNPDKDFNLIKNLVQRRIYSFLKTNGMQRQYDPIKKKQGKGYMSREIYLTKKYEEERAISIDYSYIEIKDLIIREGGKKIWNEIINENISKESFEKIKKIKEVLLNEISMYS